MSPPPKRAGHELRVVWSGHCQPVPESSFPSPSPSSSFSGPSGVGLQFTLCGSLCRRLTCFPEHPYLEDMPFSFQFGCLLKTHPLWPPTPKTLFPKFSTWTVKSARKWWSSLPTLARRDLGLCHGHGLLCELFSCHVWEWTLGSLHSHIWAVAIFEICMMTETKIMTFI